MKVKSNKENRYNIFFDFDGVIANSLALTVKTTNKVLAFYKKPLRLTVPIFRENYQTGGLLSMYTRLFGFKPEEVAEVLETRKKIMGNKFIFPPLYAGIPALLRKLSKKYNLFIISSAKSTNINKILKKYGLNTCFKKVYGQEDLDQWHKPDPQYFLTPAHRQKLNKNRIVVIGDSVDDIVGAHRAGLAAIACSWGWQKYEELIKVNPEAVANTPKELEQHINSVLKP